MPIRVGLTHTQVKLGRAYEHLEELKQVVAEFRKHGYRITRQDDSRKSVHQAIIQLKVTPDKLGALPGEFAYCLRSGLDHLAWQLALLTTDAPADCTCFPINERVPKKDSRFWESIRNIPSAAATIIDSLQPYKRGAAFKGNLLWQLNKLGNIDKHQAIAVSSTIFEVRVDGVTRVWQKDSDHAIQITVPLVEKKQLQLYVNIPRVVFGDPIDRVNGVSGFEIGIERFEEIYNFVRYDVVPRFEQFFR